LSGFGEHLDALLKERDMTRAGLARKMGKSRSTMQGICDRGNPQTTTLLAIKAAAGLDDWELAELTKSAADED